MNYFKTILCLMFLTLSFQVKSDTTSGKGPSPKELPLFFWNPDKFSNFGDVLSLKLVERIIGKPIESVERYHPSIKFLAIGSIIGSANEGDVVWGSGINGKSMSPKKYNFKKLDVRAVRGPLSRKFLKKNFKIECPEIYGDPALLIPYFFPEFKKAEIPQFDYIVIPHYSEQLLFPKSLGEHIVYPTEPWDQVVKKILSSKFVISSSLHGIIIAEAYGIPAILLKVTKKEPLFKYKDYYYGTNRPNFRYATSVEEALLMGGEPPFKCDLKKLYGSFPFEFWENATFNPYLFKK